MSLGELLNQQAEACICGKLGHSWKALWPIQTREETRQVFCICATCRRKSWIEFPPEGYSRFIKDVHEGNVSVEQS